MITAMKTILVAEDDRLARGALKRGLETAGYGVIEAEDGKQALDACKETQPDLIITDKQMPKMDGEELIEKIRETSWGKKLPIFMLTSSEETSVVNKALENNVVYFSKSISSIDEVISGVRSYVSPE